MTDNSGAAFPCEVSGFIVPEGTPKSVEDAIHEYRGKEMGLTKREWFAGMAPEPSQEEIERQQMRDRNKNPYNEPCKPRIRERLEIIAALKYAYADAMIKAGKE